MFDNIKIAYVQGNVYESQFEGYCHADVLLLYSVTAFSWCSNVV